MSAATWRGTKRRPAAALGSAFWLAAAAWAGYAQPPAITQEGVRNAASRMPPSLPGGSLAPGSLFTIDGLRLADPHAPVAVRLIAPHGTVEASLISAAPGRIEALVPADTPSGEAQLVVTRGGLSSRPLTVRIAPAFGLFSRNGKGWGAGEIENAGASANTPATPANPGSAVTLVGTGLANPRALEVFVGGTRARVLSRKPRPGQPGRQEILFRLAGATPPGCHVPVLVKLGAVVSNVVTMSVAAKGRPCPGETGPAGLLLLARVMMQARLIAGVPVDFTEDVGAAMFPPPDAGANLPPVAELLPPPGACTAYTGRWPSDFLALPAGEGRDAGTEISVSGPSGALTLTRAPTGFYQAKLGGGLPFGRSVKPPFLGAGQYRVSAQGGRDVGAWTAAARWDSTLLPLLPTHADTIDRARGVTVRWAGADRQERIIVIAANIDALTGASGICICSAPAAAGHWHVPAMLLANLPASRDAAGPPLNYLLVATLPATIPQTFTARGIAGGAVVFSTVRGRTIRYK